MKHFILGLAAGCIAIAAIMIFGLGYEKPLSMTERIEIAMQRAKNRKQHELEPYQSGIDAKYGIHASFLNSESFFPFGSTGLDLWQVRQVFWLGPNREAAVCFSHAEGREQGRSSELSLSFRLFSDDRLKLQEILQNSEEQEILVHGRYRNLAWFRVVPGSAEKYTNALKADDQLYDFTLSATESHIDSLVEMAALFSPHKVVGPCTADVDLSVISVWDLLVEKHWDEKARAEW